MCVWGGAIRLGLIVFNCHNITLLFQIFQAEEIVATEDDAAIQQPASQTTDDDDFDDDDDDDDFDDDDEDIDVDVDGEEDGVISELVGR